MVESGAQHEAPVRVIGIAGPPGSGKSTLAAALLPLLGDAVWVEMDHYQRMTDLPIEQIAHWFERGADHDELPVPLLAEHLSRLKQGHAVVNPETGGVIAPARTIILETHFGRAHGATGGFIDLLLWLDTPPDVALARNLRAFVGGLLAAPGRPDDATEGLQWLQGYLDNYLALVARLLALQRERVRPAAELIVTPATAPQALAAALLLALRSSHG